MDGIRPSTNDNGTPRAGEDKTNQSRSGGDDVRVAVVTAEHGMGEAISIALKAAGYKVAASYAGNDEAAAKFKARPASTSTNGTCRRRRLRRGLKQVEADQVRWTCWSITLDHQGRHVPQDDPTNGTRSSTPTSTRCST